MSIVCPCCEAPTTVAQNIIARHVVPGTSFPCPESGSAFDTHATVITRGELRGT